MWEDIKRIQATPVQLRNFGLLISAVLILIAGYHYFFGNPALVYLAGISIALGIGAYAFPHPLKPIYVVWMALAILLGWITSRVVLTVVFYLILTPIALIARLIGKRFMPLGFDKSVPTYWERRSQQANPRSCEKQF